MALAFKIVYEFQDDDGDRATSSFNVPTSFSLAQYSEFAVSMAELVDDIVRGKITNASLGVTVDLSAITNNTIGLLSDVEEVAAFQFSTVNNNRVKVNVPAMDENIVPAGTDDIDQADVFVAPFITAMLSGVTVTGGTIIPCDVGEDDITSIVHARENFRASGKAS